jgi:hypothetical protein
MLSQIAHLSARIAQLECDDHAARHARVRILLFPRRTSRRYAFFNNILGRHDSCLSQIPFSKTMHPASLHFHISVHSHPCRDVCLQTDARPARRRRRRAARARHARALSHRIQRRQGACDRRQAEATDAAADGDSDGGAWQDRARTFRVCFDIMTFGLFLLRCGSVLCVVDSASDFYPSNLLSCFVLNFVSPSTGQGFVQIPQTALVLRRARYCHRRTRRALGQHHHSRAQRFVFFLFLILRQIHRADLSGGHSRRALESVSPRARYARGAEAASGGARAVGAVCERAATGRLHRARRYGVGKSNPQKCRAATIRISFWKLDAIFGNGLRLA